MGSSCALIGVQRYIFTPEILKEVFMMKKRRFALVALVVLCFALVVSILPLSVIAAETTGSTPTETKLTASDAGKTLSGNYYVEPGTTLTLRGGTGVSGLKVDTNKTLTIHIPADSVLYVYGGAASSTTGAGCRCVYIIC